MDERERNTTASPLQTVAKSPHPSPKSSKFCTTSHPLARNRQISNDFLSKKHSEIKHIKGVHKPDSEHTYTKWPVKQRVDEVIAYSDRYGLVSDPSLSVVVNQSHPHPTYYKAEPTKNALREAIVEQDIGPEGASWPPQISLRNGSNHGGDRGL